MTIDFKSAQVIASLTRALDSLTIKWETAQKERDEARAERDRLAAAGEVLNQLTALVDRWVTSARGMEHTLRYRNDDFTELGQVSLQMQATMMRGCAEELRVALGQPPHGEWPTGETYP